MLLFIDVNCLEATDSLLAAFANAGGGVVNSNCIFSACQATINDSFILPTLILKFLHVLTIIIP
jgi:hypothetical protein